MVFYYYITHFHQSVGAVATNGFPFAIKRQTGLNPYAPMTEKEMLAKLEKSREQGMCRDADHVISDMKSKYGL